MDPTATPAPAAPAAEPTPPTVTPEAPAVTPEPAPAPARTQDPVDHSQAVTPEDPAPPADPAAPVDPPADPAAETPPADPDAPPAAADVVDEPPADELDEQIKAAEAANGGLPSGVNADGTIDPLVYAYENMPSITVKGTVAGGEVKEFTVKTAEDLPEGFNFADGVEQAKFSGALAQNMAAATELIADANAHNDQRHAANERRTLLVSQKNEVDALVKSGKLPEIKLKPGDSNFMQDPGAQRAQQVLDHMAAVNKEYTDQGINQKITSVAVALQLLEAKEAIEARDGRMGTISDTRSSVSSKISGNGGTPPASGAAGTTQRVHKDVQSALRAGRKVHGI